MTALPRLGLGCTTFGREIGQDESFAIMDWAVEHGLTLFDTAEAYGGGQARAYRRKNLGVDDVREVSGEMHSSELIVGRWLRSRGARNGVVLVTKLLAGHTPDNVARSCDASLERLGVDSVDVYMFHTRESATPVSETVAAMDAVVRSGRAREAGCSNYSGAQLAESLSAARETGAVRLSVTEANYNLCVRGVEADLFPLCQREGVRVLTYSPLAAGFLTGKYTPDRAAIPRGSRFDVIPGHADIYFREENFAIQQRLAALAERTGIPAPRLAIAWVLRNRAVDTVLVGARTVAHLENAVSALSLDFDPAWDL